MKNKDRIFGIHPVFEALTSGISIDKMFVQRDGQNEMQKKIIAEARKQNVPVQHVPKEKLNRLTGKNHQGIIAFLCLVEYQPLDVLIPMAFETGRAPLFIALDGITDVRNLGAIARTAECTGVNGIILPNKGSAAINEDTIKTSSGAILNMNICKVDSLKKTIELCRISGLQVLCASEKANDTIYDSVLTKPTLIIMGSEETGVSKEVLRLSDNYIKLPIIGKTSSLNVSVACGAILYEVVRQRM